MKKTYVLDTNVVLHDPLAIYKFEENEVVIPIFVIEEVDQFKKELSELGRNARTIVRILDELRAQEGASLQAGVVLRETGGLLRVSVPKVEPRRGGHGAMDNAILQAALDLRDASPDQPVVFITMDSNLRIRADVLGLRAENYEGGRIDIDELYSGIVTVDTSADLVNALAARENVDITRLSDDTDITRLHPNAGVVLRERGQPKHTALGVHDAKLAALTPLRVGKQGCWGVRPRNLEQYFALDLLLRPEVHLVTLVGKAGTGKTLLAIAAGLQSVVDDGAFSRMLVSRPIFPLGRDLGFLPGTVEEKLNPWMQPIYDNLEYIFTSGRGRMTDGRDYTELVAAGVIQVEALTYIRGRSLPSQYLIVDEAQNLTPHQVKTVITRAGANTKVVLTGDPYQIDNPYVDAASNGLTIVAQRFQDERIGAHVTLTKGERSELAERATQLL
ncbi:MAG: PhoH family protein [Sandaracinaceae bacterium]|nr:PhoH family protein [Sandaracinaceae bacterium]